MDGCAAYFIVFLVCAASGKPMVEDGAETPASEQPVAEVQSSPQPTTTTEIIDTAEPPLNCTTARNKPGHCIPRASCEYSTTAIDFTLYAPHGYVKMCKTDEVCCPLEHVALHRETSDITPPSNNGNEAFDFDDDD